ncbi:hypothetical protein [Pseudosulfitobacter sp. RP-4]
MTNQTKIRIPTDRPPANALRVDKWSDMPTGTSPARYEILGEDGQTTTITLAKGNRIILDALIERPVFCASPVRISDRVCILRRDYGVPITKEMYTNDSATDRAKFGVYFLNGAVRRIDRGAA